MASSTGSLPPPSPLAQPPDSQESAPDRFAGIPPLTTFAATTEDDKIDALHLIADSVAQQRQYASTALIFHPAVLAAIVAVFAIIGQFMYKGSRSNLPLIFTTGAGITMSFLVSIRRASSGYLEIAEKVGTWKWLGQNRTAEGAVGAADDIFLTTYGEEIIAALILRGVKTPATATAEAADGSTSSSTSSPTKKKKPHAGSALATKGASVQGVIRGWAVVNRYRHKGIGTGLLETAIRTCGERGWTGPVFATDHANAGQVLPAFFNSSFVRRDQKARLMLEKLVAENSSSTGSVNTSLASTGSSASGTGKARRR